MCAQADGSWPLRQPRGTGTGCLWAAAWVTTLASSGLQAAEGLGHFLQNMKNHLSCRLDDALISLPLAEAYKTSRDHLLKLHLEL